MTQIQTKHFSPEDVFCRPFVILFALRLITVEGEESSLVQRFVAIQGYAMLGLFQLLRRQQQSFRQQLHNQQLHLVRNKKYIYHKIT